MIKSKNWIGVFAELIKDESQDMQKYVWLAEMADDDKELKEMFKLLAYDEHVHSQKILHPVFVKLASEYAKLHGKPSPEQLAVWDKEHGELMGEHKTAFAELNFKDIVEAEAEKFELIAKLCKDESHKVKYMQIYSYLKGVK